MVPYFSLTRKYRFTIIKVILSNMNRDEIKDMIELLKDKKVIFFEKQKKAKILLILV